MLSPPSRGRAFDVERAFVDPQVGVHEPCPLAKERQVALFELDDNIVCRTAKVDLSQQSMLGGDLLHHLSVAESNE